MTTKSICKLIYVTKTGRDNIEYVRENVKFTEVNIYANRYYTTLANNSMKLSKMIKLREFYKNDFNEGILTYVIIGNTKYAISRLSNVSGRYITLDLEETL